MVGKCSVQLIAVSVIEPFCIHQVQIAQNSITPNRDLKLTEVYASLVTSVFTANFTLHFENSQTAKMYDKSRLLETTSPSYKIELSKNNIIIGKRARVLLLGFH